MRNKWILYLVFFVLLFGLYYVVVFTQTDISQSNLPVISNNIRSFSFTDQDGRTVTEKQVADKVYVAEYFFTTCRGICPRMNANMRRVYDAFRNEPDFMILSHTCMPETDSVPLMKKYAVKMMTGKLVTLADGTSRIEEDSSAAVQSPPTGNWLFLTGDKAQLYNMARHGYVVDNNKVNAQSNIEDEFIHTQFFALVDKQTRVRGIYDGLVEADIQKLLKDIRALLKEKSQNRSL